MPVRILIIAIILLTSCSTEKKTHKNRPTPLTKEFSQGEIILATQMLTKIFDGEMGEVECVPDADEASLLLRTIRPRMELVEDDIEAILDQEEEVKKLIASCEQNCTCVYVDDLLREHLVTLTKTQRKDLTQKRNEREVNRCMAYIQNTFCQSELYKALNAEKADFSFEEGVI